jgi:hypothetical protein
VTVCEPVASVALVSDAVPPLRATVPNGVAPSRNCTVPVGLDDGLTVAVNVTACPNVDGFSDEINAVDVVIALIVCVMDEDVLPL